MVATGEFYSATMTRIFRLRDSGRKHSRDKTATGNDLGGFGLLIGAIGVGRHSNNDAGDLFR
jgi:hypothetical protein